MDNLDRVLIYATFGAMWAYIGEDWFTWTASSFWYGAAVVCCILWIAEKRNV